MLQRVLRILSGLCNLRRLLLIRTVMIQILLLRIVFAVFVDVVCNPVHILQGLTDSLLLVIDLILPLCHHIVDLVSDIINRSLLRNPPLGKLFLVRIGGIVILSLCLFDGQTILRQLPIHIFGAERNQLLSLLDLIPYFGTDPRNVCRHRGKIGLGLIRVHLAVQADFLLDVACLHLCGLHRCRLILLLLHLIVKIISRCKKDQ